AEQRGRRAGPARSHRRDPRTRPALRYSDPAVDLSDDVHSAITPVTVQTDEPTTAPPPMSRRGVVTRLLAVVVGLALVIAGTVHGQDDDFPFGPFRMYSTRDDPNGAVRELRVQLLLTTGAVQDVTNASGAPRRAELE